MSNSITSVELGNRIIEIQNNRYYNPESVKVNPKGALLLSGASIILPMFFFGLFEMLAVNCVSDGPIGHTIGFTFGLVPTALTFRNLDPEAIYDSNRFALDTAGSIVGECLGFENANA